MKGWTKEAIDRIMEKRIHNPTPQDSEKNWSKPFNPNVTIPDPEKPKRKRIPLPSRNHTETKNNPNQLKTLYPSRVEIVNPTEINYYEDERQG